MVNNQTRRALPLLTGVAALAAAAFALAGCSTTPGADTAATTASSAPAAPSAAAPTTAATAETTAPSETPAETLTGTEVPVLVNSAFYDEAAGTVEVRGTVSGVIGGGTCTAILTNADGKELTAEVEAVPNAQSTVCPPAVVEGVSGSGWKASLKFVGEDAFGTAAAIDVETAQ